MTIPRWDDRSGERGTKVRVALWLLQEVGAGNTFTKIELRSAFPGVEQVDRRMRDLRVDGWRILTNIEDAGLSPNELRFATAGAEVWLPGRSRTSDVLTSKQRKEIMARDGYACATCGIAGGEEYQDSRFQTAQLSVTARKVHGDNQVRVAYLTECARCRAGGIPASEPSPAEVMRVVDQLDPAQRALLAGWVARGRREPTPADRVWTAYRRLTEEDRTEIFRRLTR